MKIIDFERKGNVIRLYLGEKTKDWGWTNKDYKDYTGKTPNWLCPSERYYGDDWNDVPYEHNAGQVYEEFIKGYKDLYVPFDDLVIEPSDNLLNSSYCKDDMEDRKIPCLIIVPKKIQNKVDMWNEDFESLMKRKDIIKIYFGDEEKNEQNK